MGAFWGFTSVVARSSKSISLVVGTKWKKFAELTVGNPVILFKDGHFR
jgi:hypothetical protein